MNKTILSLLVFIAISAGINAQNSEATLPSREFQAGIGDAMSIYGNFLGNELYMSSPTLSLSYHQRINSWLWYGATLAYNANHYNDYNLKIKQNIRTLSFAPSLRFSYVNKPNLLMYSGLQAGFSWQKFYNTDIDGKLDNQYSNQIWFLGQATAFGITFGKDFFIGGEVGFGHKGILNFVAGYRF
jgi:hypothetical protein